MLRQLYTTPGELCVSVIEFKFTLHINLIIAIAIHRRIREFWYYYVKTYSSLLARKKKYLFLL